VSRPWPPRSTQRSLCCVPPTARSKLRGDDSAVGSVVDDVASAVLREAVTNVLRHSRPTQCRVAISVTGTWLNLRVDNDGVPELTSTNAAAPGVGLHNMRERIVLRNGTFETRTHEAWFQLSATIPRRELAGAPAPSSVDRRAPRRRRRSG
jgi:two-component system, NarL family, sensor histidine kinase DesK